MPRIVIVMATWNRADLLERAIEAVQAQTYRDFELRIYDNASEDRTSDVVRRAAASDTRIVYHRHPRNIGGLANMCFGIERVESEFYAVLSDDDVPLPHLLAGCIDGFETFPDAAFSALGTLEMTEAGRLIWAPQMHWEQDGRFEGLDGVRHLLGDRFPTWNTVLFRRSALTTIGYPDPTLGLVWDLEFTLRLAAYFPFVIARKPGGIFIRHENSSSEFADITVADAYDRAIAGILSREDLDIAMRTTIANGLREMIGVRLTQIAVKATMRGDSTAAGAALDEARVRTPSGSSLLTGLRIYSPLNRIPVVRRVFCTAVNAWLDVRARAAVRVGQRHGVNIDRELISRALAGVR